MKREKKLESISMFAPDITGEGAQVVVKVVRPVLGFPALIR